MYIYMYIYIYVYIYIYFVKYFAFFRSFCKESEIFYKIYVFSKLFLLYTTHH